jgi:hypothetical protein
MKPETVREIEKCHEAFEDNRTFYLKGHHKMKAHISKEPIKFPQPSKSSKSDVCGVRFFCPNSSDSSC